MWFNTQNVIEMNGIFQVWDNLGEIILSSFDTKNANDMSNIFSNVKA